MRSWRDAYSFLYLGVNNITNKIHTIKELKRFGYVGLLETDEYLIKGNEVYNIITIYILAQITTKNSAYKKLRTQA